MWYLVVDRVEGTFTGIMLEERRRLRAAAEELQRMRASDPGGDIVL